MKLWWPLVHSNLIGLVGDLTRFYVVGENKTFEILEVLARQDILGWGMLASSFILQAPVCVVNAQKTNSIIAQWPWSKADSADDFLFMLLTE
jgi:hypothetical protein